MSDAQIDALKVGDIILTPSGNFRTVLNVVRKKRRVSVTVAILHCSWTHRPHTTLDRDILRAYRKTRDRDPNVKRRKWARKILEDAALMGGKRACACCDVIGVFQ